MAKQIQVWVSEDFKKLLQKAAIDEGCPVVEFTRRIVQDSENPFCYIIKAKDCNDVSSVERFIVKTVDDFNKEN